MRSLALLGLLGTWEMSAMKTTFRKNVETELKIQPRHHNERCRGLDVARPTQRTRSRATRVILRLGHFNLNLRLTLGERGKLAAKFVELLLALLNNALVPAAFVL